MPNFPRVEPPRSGFAWMLVAAALLVPIVARAANAPAGNAPEATPNTASSQIVVRDAASGQLRAPTPEEAKALQAPRATLRAAPAQPPQPLQRQHPSGARGIRMTDASMSYSVMVRQPDGRLVEQCFETREAAEAAVKTPVAAKAAALPTE